MIELEQVRKQGKGRWGLDSENARKTKIMTTNLRELLIELETLNLPIGEYVITSSAVMAARDIRDCSDLDLVVTETLFNELSKQYDVIENSGFSKIVLSENIEALYFGHNPNDEYSTERQIRESEMIEGFPFQNVETCLYFKEHSDREKDKADVVLIKNYLSTQNDKQ